MEAPLVPILLSDVTRLESQGYRRLESGDASKANSDYFLVMVKDRGDGERDVKIVCPAFLRGPLGFHTRGAISY